MNIFTRQRFFFSLIYFHFIIWASLFYFPTIIVIKIGFCHSAICHVKNHWNLHKIALYIFWKIHFVDRVVTWNGLDVK